MPILPFGPWQPDVSDYQGQHTKTATNVLPRGDGYGPFKDFSAYSSALAAACRGFFVALKTDGSVAIFAGTSTKLYKLSNTDFTWGDVSKASGTYSAVTSTDQWQFAQFGNYVIAVQANTAPQVFDLTISTEFADLSGSPPQSRYISIVGRFVVLSGLLSNPYRIQWSGLNDVTNWTSGVNSSDFQDFPDGGTVRGVAGGEFGVIFQDRAMRRMTYAPGSSYIFQIERLTQDKGLYAPSSLVVAGERIFFLASQGFQGMLATGFPEQIGKERIDRTFFADVDLGNFQLCIGAADPKNSRVFWSYKSNSGSSGLFDKLLCFDWKLDKWTTITTSGEYIASLSQPGITLEGLDAIFPSIDAMTTSLDDFASSVTPEIAAVNSAHILGFYRGSNLEATIDTPEQGGDGRRIYIRGLRPVTDAGTVYGNCSRRETAQASATYSTETLINAVGSCPQRVSTRYARGQIRIPSATTWTFAAGIEPDISLEGKR